MFQPRVKTRLSQCVQESIRSRTPCTVANRSFRRESFRCPGHTRLPEAQISSLIALFQKVTKCTLLLLGLALHHLHLPSTALPPHLKRTATLPHPHLYHTTTTPDTHHLPTYTTPSHQGRFSFLPLTTVLWSRRAFCPSAPQSRDLPLSTAVSLAWKPITGQPPPSPRYRWRPQRQSSVSTQDMTLRQNLNENQCTARDRGRAWAWGGAEGRKTRDKKAMCRKGDVWAAARGVLSVGPR